MFGVDGGKVPPQTSIDGEPFLDRDVGSCVDFKKPLFFPEPVAFAWEVLLLTGV